jgi:hypothetical protein
MSGLVDPGVKLIRFDASAFLRGFPEMLNEKVGEGVGARFGGPRGIRRRC